MLGTAAKYGKCCGTLSKTFVTAEQCLPLISVSVACRVSFKIALFDVREQFLLKLVSDGMRGLFLL